MFDELGSGEITNRATQQNPEMRIVTAGYAVKTRVLRRLGFVNQFLYMQEMPKISPSWPILFLPKAASA
jgi:hypothetical protein